MCLIGCDVRIRPARLGGSGVCRRPGHHRRNRQQVPAGDRLRQETDIGGRSAGGAEESSAVYQTRGHGTEGVQSPATDNCVTETDHGPADSAVPASRVRSFNVPITVGDIEAGPGGSQENSESSGNRRRATTGVGRYDTGRATIGRRSPSFEDTVSECTILSSSGSPDTPPAISRPRTEVSRLPRLFRIGSSSIERLDCSTPDGYMTQACQVS